MNISVLIPVYKNDKASQLVECFKSIKDQTYKANEIIILIDGPIGEDLKEVIDESGFTSIYFDKNRGLPHVLNDGINLAKNDWIFRMDADDIAVSDRFEKQVNYLRKNPSITLLGGQVQEFLNDVSKPLDVRAVPENSEDIRSFAKWRNPFNHPTVAFKKNVALKLGGYDSNAYFFEDHDLWLRFIADGQFVANLPEILVYMRVGQSFLLRRSGKKYIKHEIYFISKMRKLGIIGYPYFFFICALRLPLRLIPISWLEKIYKIFLRKSK